MANVERKNTVPECPGWAVVPGSRIDLHRSDPGRRTCCSVFPFFDLHLPVLPPEGAADADPARRAARRLRGAARRRLLADLPGDGPGAAGPLRRRAAARLLHVPLLPRARAARRAQPHLQGHVQGQGHDVCLRASVSVCARVTSECGDGRCACVPV